MMFALTLCLRLLGHVPFSRWACKSPIEFFDLSIFSIMETCSAFWRAFLGSVFPCLSLLSSRGRLVSLAWLSFGLWFGLWLLPSLPFCGMVFVVFSVVGACALVISRSLSENRSVSRSLSMRNYSSAFLGLSVSQVSISEVSAASRPSAVSEVAAIRVYMR